MPNESPSTTPHPDDDGIGGDTTSGPLPAALEILPAALEGACEAERLEQLGVSPSGLPGTGAPPPSLSAALRARILGAFDEVEAETLLAEALEGEGEALWVEQALAAGPASEVLAAGLRRAALDAFDRAADPAPVLALQAAAPVFAGDGRRATRPLRQAPLRARRLGPLFGVRAMAAAAAVLVALGATFVLGDRGPRAEAGLQLRALGRIERGGAVQMSQVQPRYFAALGHVFAPAHDELLSFDLADEALVVVGEGDAVRVVRAAEAAAAGLGGDAVLRLESGEARLATREHPIPLQIDGVGLLVLTEGAAHVAIDAAGGTPAVALADHSQARFFRAGGGSVPLTGPTRVLLSAQGPTAFGAPARSLFEELRLFGGPLPPPRLVRSVAARQFEPTTAGARRRGHALELVAASSGAAVSTALAWPAPAAVATAATLEVRLRAPVGTRVSLVQQPGEVSRPTAVVTEDGTQREPGTATVLLSLPATWHEHLERGQLTLQFDVPAGAVPAPAADARVVRAWFDGVALVFEAAPTPSMPNDGRSAGRDG